MAEKKLIPESLRSNESFRRDLKELLTLGTKPILALNRMAEESADGISPADQTAGLALETELETAEARRVILVASVLYESCRDQRLPVDDAIGQLADIADEMGISSFSDNADSFAELLSVKSKYETEGYARLQAKAVVPHLMDLDGVWDIRPIFHRESGEIIKRYPILLLSVSWHDDSGSAHSASFQLDDDDWADFTKQVHELEEQRSALGGEL
ncbi:MAG: hypothetical protein IH865_04220 [Chloroflexi bacterium]|nr:hypothetical protein [Chloroflexota bacterium]